jgi:hypothetical protein
LLVAGVGVSSAPLLRAETPAPIIQPWPPPPDSAHKPQPAAEDATPAVTLDHPVAIRDNGPMVDNQVQPTGLFNGRSNDALAYSPTPAFTVARPMPVGPALQSTPVPTPPGTLSVTPSVPDVPYTWQQPPSPTPLAPTPLTPQSPTTTTIIPSPNGFPLQGPAPGPVMGPAIDGGPIGHPVSDGCIGDCCGGCCPESCCAPGCCDGCGCGCGGWGGFGGFGSGCCFGNRIYGSAEYLLWFLRGQPLPPLVTTGPINANPPGALGQPGTVILWGNNSVENNPVSGGRFRLGYWLNDQHGLGIEGGFFFLGESINNFSTSSSGTPFLGRPFFNALTGLQDVEAVAAPSGLAGTIAATNRTRLWGVEANLRRNLCCGCNWFIDGLVGWRMLNLTESLNVQENLTIVNSSNPSLPVGSTFVVADNFHTQNLFNGGQIGGIGEYRLGRWIFDVRSTVALGVTQQVVDIFGTTLSQAPGSPATLSTGGLLAQTSNIGRHVHDQFSVVPEVGINVGYQFTNHIRGFVGYNFLYWSSVARPGNQVDLGVNPNLIPPQVPGGPQRPAYATHGSDFWAQGIQFGLDIRW